MSPRPIRASDLVTYVYCRRAWWYRLQGYASSNTSHMQAGEVFHAAHGWRVFRARLLQMLGWGVLLVALLALVALAVFYWLG
ncbi:hypothetical protein [uncultured Thermanaerothrix sp.]|uniref:hypothetical protein n=1 Tax=uncultured Thermanaerothrix sp. TaxID=1195149 RepID=UPI00261CE19B|nr:hypothetical protein [uncultured Thermanaerothrix sp.]